MVNRREPLAIAVASLPLACNAVLVAAACYCWAAVGNWPSYGRPDPKDLPLRAVYYSASIATLAGLVSVTLCPLAEMIYLCVQRVRTKQWRLHSARIFALYGIGAALWIIGVIGWVTSKGGLVNWIFD